MTVAQQCRGSALLASLHLSTAYLVSIFVHGNVTIPYLNSFVGDVVYIAWSYRLKLQFDSKSKQYRILVTSGYMPTVSTFC